MTPGETFAEKYLVEAELDVPGPREAYVVRFDETTARLDLPHFALRPIGATAPSLIHVLEQTEEYVVTEADDGPPGVSLELEQVVAIMRPVAAALAALHDEGYLHGALSLHAIARVGSEFKLRDAGFGAWLEEGMFDDALPEWFEHVAPEQLEIGRPTPAADIWAFGTLAFRLLTGHPYFPEGTMQERVRRLLLHPIPSATTRGDELGVHVPPEFDDFYARCLARNRNDRFATIGEALDGLARVFNRERILGRRQQLVGELERGAGRGGGPQVCLSVGYSGSSGPQTCLSVARREPEPEPRRGISRALIIVAIVLALALVAFVVIRG
jgi:hypothetical protein